MTEGFILITVFGTIWGIIINLAYQAGAKNKRLPTEEIIEGKSIFKPPRSEPMKSAEQKRIAVILENIDNYDGTGAGQKEV